MPPSHILENFKECPWRTTMHGICIHPVDDCSDKKQNQRPPIQCNLLTTSYCPSVVAWHPARILSFLLPVFRLHPWSKINQSIGVKQQKHFKLVESWFKPPNLLLTIRFTLKILVIYSTHDPTSSYTYWYSGCRNSAACINHSRNSFSTIVRTNIAFLDI